MGQLKTDDIMRNNLHAMSTQLGFPNVKFWVIVIL